MNIVFESYSNELVTSKSDIDKWINDIKELQKKALIYKKYRYFILYNFITFIIIFNIPVLFDLIAKLIVDINFKIQK